MDSVEAKILKDLGWSDEFMIPVANDENKKLASEVSKTNSGKPNFSKVPLFQFTIITNIIIQKNYTVRYISSLGTNL